jgi:hypothetical protein
MSTSVDLGSQEDQSEGFNLLLSLVREGWDDQDPWGSGISWLFALGDVVYVLERECMTDYSPAAGLRKFSDLDLDDYATEQIVYFWKAGQVKTQDMQDLFEFMSDLDDKFREEGLNY